MADIAMCRGEDFNDKICPRRDTCYRYTATPSEHRQSYACIEDVDKCEVYWPCPSRGMKKRLDLQTGG